MTPIRVEVDTSASLDSVWEAWTETDQITKWFAPEAKVEAWEGGSFELFFDPSDHGHESTRGCVFTLVEPKRHLGFTWRGPDQFGSVMNHPANLTKVDVCFKNEGGSIHIAIKHTGWGQGQDWTDARTWHERAWEQVLAELKSYLGCEPPIRGKDR